MYDLISAFGFMSFGVVVGGKISLNFTAKVAVKFKQHFQKKKINLSMNIRKRSYITIYQRHYL